MILKLKLIYGIRSNVLQISNLGLQVLKTPGEKGELFK
jgi:hypothetical protein